MILYLLVGLLVVIYAWYTAADTGKKELVRGVQPRWLLLTEVIFCGLFWPWFILPIIADIQQMRG